MDSVKRILKMSNRKLYSIMKKTKTRDIYLIGNLKGNHKGVLTQDAGTRQYRNETGFLGGGGKQLPINVLLLYVIIT